MKERLMRYFLPVVGVIAIFAISQAEAQEVSTESQATSSQASTSAVTGKDPWRFTVAPYFWGTSMDGKAGVQDIETDVDISFGDILKDVSIALMVYGEARKDKFGFFVAPFYVRLHDKNSGPIDSRTTNQSVMMGGGAFYRLAEWQTGEGADGNPLTIAVEPYIGARLTYMRLEIELSQGSGPIPNSALPQEDKSRVWVDPIVGTRVGMDLTENWSLFAEGDVGGFGVGSDFSWQTMGYLGYRGSAFGVPTTYVVGYRALSQDYDKDDFKWDVTQHGPMLGAAFHF